MSTLSRRRIRLAVDAAKRPGELAKDLFTNQTPECWLANDLQVEVGVYFNGVLQTVENLAFLSVKICDLDNPETVLASHTLAGAALDNTCDQTSWDDESKQHGLFAFTDAETNIVIASGLQRTCGLFVTCSTTDSPANDITIQATKIRITRDSMGAGNPPASDPDLYYTKEESAALFAPIHADGAHWQWHDGAWYVYCPDDGLWYTQTVRLIDGVPTFAPSAGVAL
jgi:hypothetical protein